MTIPQDFNQPKNPNAPRNLSAKDIRERGFKRAIFAALTIPLAAVGLWHGSKTLNQNQAETLHKSDTKQERIAENSPIVGTYQKSKLIKQLKEYVTSEKQDENKLLIRIIAENKEIRTVGQTKNNKNMKFKDKEDEMELRVSKIKDFIFINQQRYKLE